MEGLSITGSQARTTASTASRRFDIQSKSSSSRSTREANLRNVRESGRQSSSSSKATSVAAMSNRSQPKASQRIKSPEDDDSDFSNSDSGYKRWESKEVKESKDESSIAKTNVTRTRKPTGIKRASKWSPEIEECYRLQTCGYSTLSEYTLKHGDPERWEGSGFRQVKCLRIKENGYFSYWREGRECEDKYLNRVKVYTYD